MFKAGSIQKPISRLKLTWYVVLLVGVLYPLLFTLINRQYTLAGFISGILVNCVLLSLMVGIVFCVTSSMGRLPDLLRDHFLRYLLEFICVVLIIYWLLRGVYYLLVAQTNATSGNWQDWQYRYFMGVNLVAASFIYLFQLGLTFYHITQQKIAESEKAQKDFAQVRLQALHNQINPHFLFNSLSVLSSLVHINVELSEKFIVQLSVAYRYILDGKDIEWVTLGSELHFLDAYFF